MRLITSNQTIIMDLQPRKKIGFSSVRLTSTTVSKQLYQRLCDCKKKKGLREVDIQRQALEEYLTKNNF